MAFHIEYDPTEPAAPTGPHGQAGNPHVVRSPLDRVCRECGARLTVVRPRAEGGEATTMEVNGG